MGEHLAVNCCNWGNPVCHPDVRKCLDWGHKEAVDFPIFPANGAMKKFDEICRTCNFLEFENHGDDSKREDRYNPVFVISNVWGKFQAFPTHRNSRIEDFTVFIEIKSGRKKGYLIEFGDAVFLWRGTRPKTGWMVIEDPEELHKKRHLLGKVHVRFKGRRIKIGNKPLDPFPDYEAFWNYIRR